MPTNPALSRIKRPLRLLQSVWRWLVEPPGSLAGPERRRARLLAGLLLSLFSLAGFGALLSFLREPTANPLPGAFFPVTVVGVLLLLLAYCLNRIGHYRLAAILTVAITALVVWAEVITVRLDNTFLVLYLLVSVILSSVLFSPRAAAVLALAHLAGMAFVRVFIPQLSEVVSVSAFVFFVFMSLFTIVSAAIRQRDLAQTEKSEERFQLVAWATRDVIRDWDLITGKVWWSDGLQRLFQYRPDEAGAQISWWSERIHPEERDKVMKSVRLAIESGAPFWSKEYRYRRADGAYVNVFDRGYILRDEQQKAIRMIGAMIDLTARKQVEAALRESEARYRAVAESANDAIISVDNAGKIIYWNKGAIDIFGYSPEEAVSQSVTMLMPERYRADHQAGLERVGRGGEQHVLGKTIELFGLRKDGAEFPLEISIAAWETGEGKFYSSIVRDITARKQAEEARRKSEEDYRMLSELAEREARGLALLDQVRSALARQMELPLIFRTVVETVVRSFGYTQVSLYQRRDELLVLAHQVGYDHLPEQLPVSQGVLGRVARVGQPVWLDASRADPGFEEQAEGSISKVCVPLVDRDKVIGILNVESADGEPLTQMDLKLMVAVSLQASIAIGRARLYAEARENEAALREANEKLTRGLNELEQRNREIALLNELGGLLQTCLTLEEAYGVIGQSARRLFPQDAGALYVIDASRNLAEAVAQWGPLPPDERLFGPADCWGLRRGQPHRVTETRPSPRCKHLTSLPPAYLCAPIMAQSELLGLFHLQSAAGPQEGNHEVEARLQLAQTVADSIALALSNLRLRETLRQQSIRDPLTGLFNRRYLEETLEREIVRAARSERPISVIMLDLDHFKQFNDTFGHEAGDLLLRELGRFLHTHVRGSDIACRYGGEEFILILPDAPLAAAQQRAEQLREGIHHLEARYRGQMLGIVTMSLGVAACPEHGVSAEAMLRAADVALYRAKRAGRDRVMTAV